MDNFEIPEGYHISVNQGFVDARGEASDSMLVTFLERVCPVCDNRGNCATYEGLIEAAENDTVYWDGSVLVKLASDIEAPGACRSQVRCRDYDGGSFTHPATLVLI
jgi:hypothetical protein